MFLAGLRLRFVKFSQPIKTTSLLSLEQRCWCDYCLTAPRPILHSYPENRIWSAGSSRNDHWFSTLQIFPILWRRGSPCSCLSFESQRKVPLRDEDISPIMNTHRASLMIKIWRKLWIIWIPLRKIVAPFAIQPPGAPWIRSHILSNPCILIISRCLNHHRTKRGLHWRVFHTKFHHYSAMQ